MSRAAGTQVVIGIALAVMSGCGKSRGLLAEGGASGGGRGGTTGSSGASGSIGTGGSAGAGGSGGVSGSGGAGESGGAGGSTGGTAGAAGTNAEAGAGGLGGSVGVGGSAGGSGVGGPFSCSSVMDLTCGASALTLMDGHVTNFSPQEWSATSGQWCDDSGLRGSIFSYSGGSDTSSNAQAVDSSAGNFHLMLKAGPGGFAGGGLNFNRCVNVSAWNAIRFTAWVASGALIGCTFRAELETYDQRPTTQNPPGGCDRSIMNCFGFPASANIPLSTTPTPVMIALPAFTGGAHTTPIVDQIIGLQWQLDSAAPLVDGGAQLGCTAEIRIDDIDFVTQ